MAPDNRRVARNLEQNLNERLEQLERLEREKILALAPGLPALWEASTTTQGERKRLLRLLIKDVHRVKYLRHAYGIPGRRQRLRSTRGSASAAQPSKP